MMKPTTMLPKTMTVEDLPRLKWSIEDYHKLIEHGLLEDKKVERLCGEIIEMVPEGEDHRGHFQAGDFAQPHTLSKPALILAVQTQTIAQREPRLIQPHHLN